VSFRFESWIRNASDGLTLSALITLRAVDSESALPIQMTEPSGLSRNTSRASIVAPRRDKATSDIRVTRIKGNGAIENCWKTRSFVTVNSHRWGVAETGRVNLG